MGVTILRKVEFCAGHRLLHHEGKCANLHGHNYLVEFHISSSGMDSLGRVVDFAVINRLFRGWIEDHWDHGFLVWDEDREAIAALQSVQPHRVYCLPWNPTAENIARYLAERIGPQLLAGVPGYQLTVEKIVVWETTNSAACWTVDRPQA